MTTRISAHDPRYQQAIDEFKAEFGISIPDMLLPTMWSVMLLEGRPEIVITRDGMRAMALTAPAPDAVKRVEDLIAYVDDRWPMT